MITNSEATIRKGKFLAAATSLTLLTTALTTPAFAQSDLHAELAAAGTNEVIVYYNSRAAMSASPIEGDVAHHSNVQPIQIVELREGGVTDEALRQLIADGHVAFVEPNYIRQPHRRANDAEIANQWAVENQGGSYYGRNAIAAADAQLARAWDIQTGSKDVVIAIIDNGLDMNHPDLVKNLWVNHDEIPGNGLDDDNNGFIDDVHGWDFENNDSDPSTDFSGSNHGTSVAGMAGASGNNGIGIAGASWNVSLMILKTEYSVAGTIKAMEYALENGATIVNTSFGGLQHSRAEYNVIQTLADNGVLVVASAGNDHWDNDFGASYPGSYDLSNIIAVAASTPSDQLTGWTQYGQFSVDLAAPGDAVLTTEGNGAAAGGGYGRYNGTSFASPLVAGVAALIKSSYPNADASEMKGRILGSVDPIAQGACRLASGGRINAAAALQIGAQPVPVVTAIEWDDGHNLLPDAGETATLRVTVENYWQSASGVVARLTSSSSKIQVLGQEQQVDLRRNGRSELLFSVRSSASLSGQNLVALKLELSAGGWGVERDFCLNASPLVADNEITATIQQNAMDDMHRFHIEVPADIDELTVNVNAGSDVDLYLTQAGWAPRDQKLRTAGGYDRNHRMYIASGSGGSESLRVTAPAAGTWYVTVVNAGQQSRHGYRVAASFTGAEVKADKTGDSTTGSTVSPTSTQVAVSAPREAASGGGGGLFGLPLLMILLLVRRRKEQAVDMP